MVALDGRFVCVSYRSVEYESDIGPGIQREFITGCPWFFSFSQTEESLRALTDVYGMVHGGKELVGEQLCPT